MTVQAAPPAPQYVAVQSLPTAELDTRTLMALARMAQQDTQRPGARTQAADVEPCPKACEDRIKGVEKSVAELAKRVEELAAAVQALANK